MTGVCQSLVRVTGKRLHFFRDKIWQQLFSMDRYTEMKGVGKILRNTCFSVYLCAKRNNHIRIYYTDSSLSRTKEFQLAKSEEKK